MGVKKVKKTCAGCIFGRGKVKGKERDWNPFGFQSLIEEW